MNLFDRCSTRRAGAVLTGALLCAALCTTTAAAADRLYFAATDNITNVLVQTINAETVRVDMSCWYLTERSISIALLNKFKSGVPVRLIGDRGAMFEIDPLTKNEFYWLASQGVPIRLRFNPTWFPEIDHMKMTLFAGQNLVAFGSANYTPFELAPWSSTNYKDETVLFTDDSSLVNAFRTRFDQIWNDTRAEPQSLVPNAPYLKDWKDACISEPTGCDFFTQYPNPAPMTINTARLEPDYPMPADLIWGQGPEFNNRLVTEINREQTSLQFVIYRLTVDSITNALLAKFQSGVPMKLMIEPNEYLNRRWPEFWLSHANIDKLWAAGVPIKWRIHDGLTHMKTLVTSTYATNASSNFSAAWQRDDDYFISAATKPAIYQAMKDRVTAMWNDTSAFAAFQPQPPDAPVQVSPASNATGVSTTTPLVWNIATFAVSYDIYMGTSSGNMTLVGNVPAQMVNDPPKTYSWTPTAPLQPGTTYVWKVVSRTNATPVNPSLVAASSIWGFTTGGSAGPPTAPINPTPSNAATGVGTAPTLGWSAGAVGTTFNVAFGTNNPPSPVATGLTSSSYAPGTLQPSTTYFWRVTAVSSGGSTAGSVWSFTTGSGATGAASEVVIYASDVTSLFGTWSKVADSTAAGGIKLTSADNGVAALDAPQANPANYFDATFQAQAGTRYRVWLRIHALADSKFNDSVFVQFSDSVDAGGAATYRTGTPGGYTVNLWTCSTCQSFGWGWQRNGYWLADTGDVWFQNTGTHTIRVQNREDGAEIDQIVISPVTYATNAPGPVSNDTTIVPKPSGPTLPGAPGSPAPADAATGVTPNPTLTWSASGATSYDVAFGTTNPPPVVVSGASTASYVPPALSNGTTYYWRITARNASGATTGAVWSFVTATSAPATPSAPTPVDGATGQPTTLTLTWTSAGATTYDVLLGPSDPPSQVATGLTSPSYTASGLTPGATYIWQIVAHNSGGANQGPVWTFTTAAQPPAAATSSRPADGATGIGTSVELAWASPTGASSYDLNFGSTNPPPRLATGLTTNGYGLVTDLTPGTTYLWQVISHNSAGTTNGPIWTFTTAGQAPSPSTPSQPNPANGATDANPSTSLSWSATNATSYDVKFGTTNPPPTVSTGQSAASYTTALAAGTTYFWQIVAHNGVGSTVGPLWSFTTGTASTPPPAPTNPNPANGATGVSTRPTLTWTASTSVLGYGVSFGTTNPPPGVTSVGAGNGSYTPPPLSNSTTYYWQVVAWGESAQTEGPVWSFTTAAAAQPPTPPATPNPANGVSAAPTNATLSWTAGNATSYDVKFGPSNPPAQVVTGQAGTSYTPPNLAAQTTYFWQIVANNSAGSTAGPVWSFTTAAAVQNTHPEIVIYASDIPSSALHGSWTAAADPTSPGGVKLVTPDNGFASTDAPLSAPANYVDVPVIVDGRTDYTIWIRMKALNDNKFNDSLWVQFAGALFANSNVYTIGSTSALDVNLANSSTATSLNNWGWQNGAYWLSQPVTVQFATTGPHTMRIQVREDGVQFDQIVMSSTRYLTNPPGPITNDTTIVPKP
jgi:hypothetical protein